MKTFTKLHKSQKCRVKQTVIVLILLFTQHVQAVANQIVTVNSEGVYTDEVIDAIESLSVGVGAAGKTSQYFFPAFDRESDFITTDVQSNNDLIKPIATNKATDSADDL